METDMEQSYIKNNFLVPKIKFNAIFYNKGDIEYKGHNRFVFKYFLYLRFTLRKNSCLSGSQRQRKKSILHFFENREISSTLEALNGQ